MWLLVIGGVLGGLYEPWVAPGIWTVDLRVTISAFLRLVRQPGNGYSAHAACVTVCIRWCYVFQDKDNEVGRSDSTRTSRALTGGVTFSHLVFFLLTTYRPLARTHTSSPNSAGSPVPVRLAMIWCPPILQRQGAETRAAAELLCRSLQRESAGRGWNKETEAEAEVAVRGRDYEDLQKYFSLLRSREILWKEESGDSQMSSGFFK